MKNCFKSWAFNGTLIAGISTVVVWGSGPSKIALGEVLGTDHIVYRVAAPFLDKLQTGSSQTQKIGVAGMMAGTLRRLFAEDGDLYSHQKLPGKNEPEYQPVFREAESVEISYPMGGIADPEFAKDKAKATEETITQAAKTVTENMDFSIKL